MRLRAPLTAAALFATASIAAQAQARPMTPEDVAKLESVGADHVPESRHQLATPPVELISQSHFAGPAVPPVAS